MNNVGLGRNKGFQSQNIDIRDGVSAFIFKLLTGLCTIVTDSIINLVGHAPEIALIESNAEVIEPSKPTTRQQRPDILSNHINIHKQAATGPGQHQNPGIVKNGGISQEPLVVFQYVWVNQIALFK